MGFIRTEWATLGHIKSVSCFFRNSTRSWVPKAGWHERPVPLPFSAAAILSGCGSQCPTSLATSECGIRADTPQHKGEVLAGGHLPEGFWCLCHCSGCLCSWMSRNKACSCSLLHTQTPPQSAPSKSTLCEEGKLSLSCVYFWCVFNLVSSGLLINYLLITVWYLARSSQPCSLFSAALNACRLNCRILCQHLISGTY